MKMRRKERKTGITKPVLQQCIKMHYKRLLSTNLIKTIQGFTVFLFSCCSNTSFMVSLWSTERLIDSILFECGNFVNKLFLQNCME